MANTLHHILQTYWGYPQFRPGQEAIIQHVLAGKNALALLPTGGGKSLCYQVPALAQEGMCIVVSPLIALMKDQADSLNSRGIPALMIYSGMKRHEVENTLRQAINGRCKFLYVSPERLETQLFLEYLPGMDVNLVAVDEAHCISQWGYDFRPPYLRIAALREHLPHTPVLALTASATPEVQQDICEKLLFTGHTIFRNSFLRPNIAYSVQEVESKITRAAELLTGTAGSAIVYCKSRRRTREVSDMLRQYGVIAGYYHAGLGNEERALRQKDWIENRLRVIVCTNAFGMGIDKPDVRMVIHYDAPDCLENYYQEAGRAGRDGQYAQAVLLYQPPDIEELEAGVAWRFPPEAVIKEVYLAIANYLQLPAGAGAGQYFEFDLNDFVNKFRQHLQVIMPVLKLLEQEELVAYNEAVMLPSTVAFTTNKNILYQFEQQNPFLEPLIKTLLRTYSGIYDYPAFIYEKQLAYNLRKEAVIIKEQLEQLHRAGIIDYTPIKEKPQLYFISNRVSGDQFAINRALYRERKRRYEERLKVILQYISDTGACRSITIAAYFGDAALQPCGICDNCLRRSDAPLSQRQIVTARQFLVNYLQTNTTATAATLRRLPVQGLSAEKLWQVIEYMLAEEEIMVTKEGYTRLTK